MFNPTIPFKKMESNYWLCESVRLLLFVALIVRVPEKKPLLKQCDIMLPTSVLVAFALLDT